MKALHINIEADNFATHEGDLKTTEGPDKALRRTKNRKPTGQNVGNVKRRMYVDYYNRISVVCAGIAELEPWDII